MALIVVEARKFYLETILDLLEKNSVKKLKEKDVPLFFFWIDSEIVFWNLKKNYQETKL